jgi:hypothetical protein
MLLKQNETYGPTVILSAGDRLDDVPESHAGLLTPALRRIFEDPNNWLCETAERCPFPEMRAWLLDTAGSGEWQLELDREGHDPDISFAGFYWPGMERYARVTPPEEELPEYLSETIEAFFSLIGELEHFHV